MELSGKKEEETKSAEKVRFEVINKAQKVVNESHVEEIKEIFLTLKTELFEKTQKRFFIIIDDLDKEWISNKIVYDLIKALIDTIKEFCVIPNTKIIIALRSNIHKKIFKENTARGIQREKYNHLYINLEWSKNEFKQLINNRLKELMKSSYTNDSPVLEDILPDLNKRQQDTWDYILERTFLRPRDVIDFFNKCIKNSEGKTKFTGDIIRAAENEYSNERLQAINDEWLENYGSLECLYGFLNKINENFKIDDIKYSAEDYFINEISTNNINNLSDELKEDFERFGKDFNTEILLKKVLLILYYVGILGIKINSESKFEFIYKSLNIFDSYDIDEKTKFCIHPMFYKALRIT